MKRLRFQNQYGANSQLFKIFTRFMSFVLIICLSVVLLVYSYGVRTISKKSDSVQSVYGGAYGGINRVYFS